MNLNNTGFRHAIIVLLTAVVALAGELARADIYVVEAGGAAGLRKSIAVKQFTDLGNLVNTIDLSTGPFPVGQTALSLTGAFADEGFLKTSTDGRYLTLGAVVGAPGVAHTGMENRAIARIDLNTNAVDTSTRFLDSTFVNNSIRSVVTDNGARFWLGGTSSGGGASGKVGIRYATLGATTSAQINTTPTTTRVLDVFNGQLYMSTVAGTYQGVSTVGSGLPTMATQAVTQLPGFPTTGIHGSYDFWLKDANTLYLADDGSAANGGGIQKWVQAGGIWALQYTLLNNGANATGVRGLTGKVVDGATVLFATTDLASANRLISLTDTGPTATAVTLATAGGGISFRGLDVATPLVDADFDGDLDVDGNDFVLWQRNLGTGTSNAQGNTDGDLDVDATDLENWKLKFGLPVATVAGAAVPEPGSMAMVAVALCMAGAARRRR